MNTEQRIESFDFTPTELNIIWQDGRLSRLNRIWLRDHCQMPASRNPSNGQRLLNVTDIPDDLHIAQVEQQDSALAVTFLPENHVSVFSLSWLRANCYCLNKPFDDRSESGKTLWDGGSFTDGLPSADYDQYRRDAEVRRQTLAAVKEHGFVLLKDVPCKDGEILNVIRTFGFCRETNYGSLFDVRTVVDPNNLAFSNLGLGCHADNPYRDPVPSVQLLHCLASSAEGGDSILVDGFRAAALLREESAEHFALLTRQPLNFRFADGNTDLRSRVPFIEVDEQGRITKARYNNRSIDTIRLAPDQIEPFYRAYRHYAEILERPALKVMFKLTPGDLVLFDNTRVFHARTAFSAGGQRHLQGAYADLDGLYSTLAVLDRSACEQTAQGEK